MATRRKTSGALSKDEKGLTHLQRRFCECYIVNPIGSKAVRAAGYSCKTASMATTMAHELLQRPAVIAEIERLRELQSKRTEITADKVVQELAKIGFSNLANYWKLADGEPYIDLTDTTLDQMAAISEATVEDFTEGRGEDAREIRRVKIKLHNKVDALTQLGRHFGIFNDKVQHTFDLSNLTEEELDTVEAIVAKVATKPG